MTMRYNLKFYGIVLTNDGCELGCFASQCDIWFFATPKLLRAKNIIMMANYCYVIDVDELPSVMKTAILLTTDNVSSIRAIGEGTLQKTTLSTGKTLFEALVQKDNNSEEFIRELLEMKKGIVTGVSSPIIMV